MCVVEMSKEKLHDAVKRLNEAFDLNLNADNLSPVEVESAVSGTLLHCWSTLRLVHDDEKTSPPRGLEQEMETIDRLMRPLYLSKFDDGIFYDVTSPGDGRPATWCWLSGDTGRITRYVQMLQTFNDNMLSKYYNVGLYGKAVPSALAEARALFQDALFVLIMFKEQVDAASKRKTLESIQKAAEKFNNTTSLNKLFLVTLKLTEFPVNQKFNLVVNALDAKEVRRAVLLGLIACYMALRFAAEETGLSSSTRNVLREFASDIELMTNEIMRSDLAITVRRDSLKEMERKLIFMRYEDGMVSDCYELYKAAVTLVFVLDPSSGALGAARLDLAKLLYPKQSPVLMF